MTGDRLPSNHVGTALLDLRGLHRRRRRRSTLEVSGADMGLVSTEERKASVTGGGPAHPGLDGVIDLRADPAPATPVSQVIRPDSGPAASDRSPLRRYLLAGDLVALVLAWVPWYLDIGNGASFHHDCRNHGTCKAAYDGAGVGRPIGRLAQESPECRLPHESPAGCHLFLQGRSRSRHAFLNGTLL